MTLQQKCINTLDMTRNALVAVSLLLYTASGGRGLQDL